MSDSEPAKLIVNKRHEFIHCGSVAAAPPDKKIGYVAHRFYAKPSSIPSEIVQKKSCFLKAWSVRATCEETRKEKLPFALPLVKRFSYPFPFETFGKAAVIVAEP